MIERTDIGAVVREAADALEGHADRHYRRRKAVGYIVDEMEPNADIGAIGSFWRGVREREDDAVDEMSYGPETRWPHKNGDGGTASLRQMTSDIGAMDTYNSDQEMYWSMFDAPRGVPDEFSDGGSTWGAWLQQVLGDAAQGYVDVQRIKAYGEANAHTQQPGWWAMQPHPWLPGYNPAAGLAQPYPQQQTNYMPYILAGGGILVLAIALKG